MKIFSLSPLYFYF